MNAYPTLYTPPSSEEDTKSAFFGNSEPDTIIGNASFIPQAYFVLDDAAEISQQDVSNEPYLEIQEQPVEKFRFRYKSEMAGTHGSLTGMSQGRVKSYPTVQLHNYCGSAVVRCSLYQVTGREDADAMLPHAHRLIKKCGSEEKDDPHEIEVSNENNYVARFHGMGIIHTAKKNMVTELVRKKTQLRKEEIARQEGKYRNLKLKEEVQIKGLAEEESKSINLNTVCLRFDAFIKTPNNIYKPICQPVFTHGINNLKSALTGELKIVRMDHCTSPSVGNREIFILVEKVTKKNIKIRFFEIDDDENVVWEDYGRFSDLDVHHQYAIVFKTPPYKDRNITDKVTVYVELVRPSDNSRSDPKEFSYTPSDVVGNKRARSSSYCTSGYSSSISSRDLPETVHSFENMSFGSPVVNSEELDRALSDMTSEDFKKLFNEYQQLHVDAPIRNKNFKPRHMQNRVSKEECDALQRVLKEFSSLLKAKENEGRMEQFLNYYFGSGTVKHNALHVAIKMELKDRVKYFLTLFYKFKKDHLVNSVNENKETALHVALKQQTGVEIVKMILMLRPNLKLKDAEGNTPLHIAVKQENGVFVDQLLSVPKVEDFINEENDDGDTALKIAIDNENIKILRRLCEKNADVNMENKKDGSTSLHCAVRRQSVEIVKYLLEETSVDVRKKDFSDADGLDVASALFKEDSKVSCEIFAIVKQHMEKHGYTTDIVIKQEVEEDSSDDDMEKEEVPIKRENLSLEDLKALYDNISIKSEKWTKCLNKVSELLDESQGWQDLIVLLDLQHLTKTNLFHKKPSHTLLSYAAVSGQSIFDIRNLLENLNELEAVREMDSVVF